MDIAACLWYNILCGRGICAEVWKEIRQVKFAGDQMKITIETPNQGEEDEIIVRCASLDEKLMHLIYELKAGMNDLNGYMEDRIVKLSVKDIFYFESVDSKVFAYTAGEVYEIHKKLYEIEREFEHTDYLRICKTDI